MNEKVEMLHELCQELMKEIEEINNKINRAGGMSTGDLETIDKLTHALKSIKATIAMMESEEGGYSGEYSGRYMMPYYGRSYEGGMGGGGNSNRGGSSYRYGNSNRGGSSYARGGRGGRGNNPTGRNQYSRESGYSYADGMEDLLEEMRDLLPGLSEEKKRKAERLIEELQD